MKLVLFQNVSIWNLEWKAFLFRLINTAASFFFSVHSVTELCEYAANVDIAIARESIRAVGKIALQQYDVNAIVDRLLQFLEMEKDYVTAETLVNCHMYYSVR